MERDSIGFLLNVLNRLKSISVNINVYDIKVTYDNDEIIRLEID